MLYINVSNKYVQHVQGLKCTCIYSPCSCTHTVKNTGAPKLQSDHNVLSLSRALSLPCLLNSIWKHNERVTGLTTLTSKLLHQCFHPLAFSFSTHHFPLLCNWETMTTSESWGWSYMKEAEGVEPTVMWLALSLHTLGSSSASLLPFLLFWRFSLLFLPSRSLFCFLSGKPAWAFFWSFLSNFRSHSFISESTIISPSMSPCQLLPLSIPTPTSSNVWTHTHGCVLYPIMAPESRPSSRPLRPTLTKTTI